MEGWVSLEGGMFRPRMDVVDEVDISIDKERSGVLDMPTEKRFVKEYERVTERYLWRCRPTLCDGSYPDFEEAGPDGRV